VEANTTLNYSPCWYPQPKMMVIDNVIHHNQKGGQEGDSEDLALDSNMLSVHASFIIVNFQGLEAPAVELELRQHNNVFMQAFEVFLDKLMATECPQTDSHQYKPCWHNTGSGDPSLFESAYDSETGSLCGSHAEYVRQIFCKELYGNDRRGRDLKPAHIIENIVLYRVQDSNCPIPLISQGEGKVILSGFALARLMQIMN
jgi:hypothetical protein